VRAEHLIPLEHRRVAARVGRQVEDRADERGTQRSCYAWRRCRRRRGHGGRRRRLVGVERGDEAEELGDHGGALRVARGLLGAQLLELALERVGDHEPRARPRQGRVRHRGHRKDRRPGGRATTGVRRRQPGRE
jgi:hypothetical protein